MRAPVVVLVALLAALVGAVAALGIGRGAGWLAGGGTRTIVLTQQPAAAAPAVVRVPALPVVGRRFDPARLYRERAAGVVTIFAYFGSSSGAEVAQGSGFVVSRSGYVLTNSHVITTAGEGSGPAKPAKAIYLEFEDHDRVPARIVGWDVFDDVGVLRVSPHAHPLHPVPLGTSSTVVVGEPVAAIGSPLGNEDSLATGVVSGVRRAIEALTAPGSYRLIDAIQTDAPITHGNSGGPLFDARGAVIGINAQIRSQGSGGNDTGIGFAVPIDSAKRSFEQLVKTGRVAYAYVGIRTEDLIPSLARHFGYPVRLGAAIDRVEPGSPAQHAGLRGGGRMVEYEGLELPRGGDVIVAIDGIRVRSADDVVRIVSERLLPGEVARFTIVRAGRRRTVSVRLGSRPSD